VLEARDALLRVLVPALSLQQFLRRGRNVARALRVLRPHRPMQLLSAGKIMGRGLG